MAPEEESATRRQSVTVRRFESAADADLHDLEYWLQIPDADLTSPMNPDFVDLLRVSAAQS